MAYAEALIFDSPKTINAEKFSSVIHIGQAKSAGFCCQVPANPARPCKGTGLNVRSRRLLTQPLLPVHDCHLQLYVLNRYGGISPKQS